MKNNRYIFILLVILGNLLYTLTVKLFLLPANLISCGTTGIALVAEHYFHIPMSGFILAFNMAMLCLGWGVLGRKFAMTTVLSSILYPVILELLNRLLGDVVMGLIGKAGFLVVHVHDDTGHIRQIRQNCRPEPPFSGDQLIAKAHPPYRQRLQNSMLPDALGQLPERFLPKYCSGLRWIGSYGSCGQENHPSGFHVGFQFLALHSPFPLSRLYCPFYSPPFGKLHENSSPGSSFAPQHSPQWGK